MIDMSQVTAITKGGVSVTKIEKDGEQLWPTPASHSGLIFESYDGNSFTLVLYNTTIAGKIQYRVNDGSWQAWGSTTSKSFAGTDKVELKSTQKTITDYYSFNIFASSGNSGQVEVSGELLAINDYSIYATSGSTVIETYKILYNIRSLIKTVGLEDEWLEETKFNQMFKGFSNLINVSIQLPANIRHTSGLAEMFAGCTTLKDVTLGGDMPNIYATNSPSDTSGMFYNCTSLENPPKYYDGFTLKYWVIDSSKIKGSVDSMRAMFASCTALTRAPEFKIANDFSTVRPFSRMFWGCTSLAELWIRDVTIDISNMFYSFLTNNTQAGILHTNATISSGSNYLPTTWTIQPIT